MQSYNVGDVIWVVGRERPGLRVFQIVEEVTKKTLQGEVTTYMISPPSQKQEKKKMNLSKVDGEVFTSADDARISMTSNAEKAIAKMFEHTEALVSRFFLRSEPTVVVEEKSNLDQPEGDYEKIVLENGQVARIKMPDGL